MKIFQALAASAFLGQPLLSVAESTLVGPSALIDAAHVQVLSGRLGAGDVALTRIFLGDPSTTTAEFHAAVDGRGATFTVVEAVRAAGLLQSPPLLLGGYNPLSWTSIEGTVFSPTPVEQTAFLFNLTDGLYLPQGGAAQSFNHPGMGPAFGENGVDFNIGRLNSLFICCSPGASVADEYPNGLLNWGTSVLSTYAVQHIPEGFPGTIRDPFKQGGRDTYLYGRTEIFVVTVVPEPETYALLMAGLGALGFMVRRREQKSLSTGPLSRNQGRQRVT
ncbi:MAG TPA: PEP_CTERM-anchored TLD domain-containing protein [Caldimonas sp.]|jgi:hypothetical protein|nr:PEP_CTERM-anchored TLD domain-containing protein [Caldimonas sp.]HEX2541506.1 PEP_CTERM-anchored TLD domain-containing protein [Caldimonas sp.]